MFIHSSTLLVHQPFESVMENLEWKQGLLSSQCYLSMQISCWLQIAPQRRIQRQITSHIPPAAPRGACSNLAGLYRSYHEYGVLHYHAICLDWTWFVWMPHVCFLYQICELCNAILFSQSSYMWIVSCHLFFIMYSICEQCLYIHLLFLCISHLARSWKNLEWKKVFGADNAIWRSACPAGYR